MEGNDFLFYSKALLHRAWQNARMLAKDLKEKARLFYDENIFYGKSLHSVARTKMDFNVRVKHRRINN